MKSIHIHKIFAIALMLAGMLLLAGHVSANTSEINLADSESLAVQGYDVMAYWNDGEAKEGDPDISFEYKGAMWHFASVENRDAFAEEPEKYAPQYGGYCAYAAGNNALAPIDVNAWTIHEDKLYLNYSDGIRERWSKDIEAYIASADKNWPGLLEK